MIYILFISLIVLFMFCYLLSGKDFFAPATVQILTFACTICMCIYYMWSMNAPYTFHWETIEIIASTMVLTAVIGIAVHHFLKKVEIQTHTAESVNISPISGTMSIFFAGIILFSMGWLFMEILRIGGTEGSFSQIMIRFHDINSYSVEESGRLPFVLNQLLSFIRVLFLIYAFNLIRFFDVLTIGQKCMNFIILILCCISMLLTGGRSSSVNQLIGCFVMFHLLRIQREGKYKQYSLKFLVRMALLLIAIMVSFFLVKGFVGRSKGTMGVIDYLAFYTGTQYISLDQYLQNPLPASNIFGKETFYSLIQFLSRYANIGIPAYIVHLEFRPVGAGHSGNVYTFIRAYYHDFGIVGMYLLHGLSILILTMFYEHVKRRRGNLGILFFSQMYYTIVMSFFAERFYSTIFGFGYIKMLVMMLVLYELLIRKRIRLVFRRTKNRIPNKVISGINV